MICSLTFYNVTSCYVISCYIMLSYISGLVPLEAMTCDAMLYYFILGYVVSCQIILCYVILSDIMSHTAILLPLQLLSTLIFFSYVCFACHQTLFHFFSLSTYFFNLSLTPLLFTLTTLNFSRFSFLHYSSDECRRRTGWRSRIVRYAWNHFLSFYISFFFGRIFSCRIVFVSCIMLYPVVPFHIK